MKTGGLFLLTAFAEILGCYAVYGWVRLSKPLWWLCPGSLALILFSWLLTLHSFQHAGRVYAAYGGVYIATSLFWLWAVEGKTPDRWDFLGTLLCLMGAAIIYGVPRS